MVIITLIFLFTTPIYLTVCQDRENFNNSRYVLLDNITQTTLEKLFSDGTIPKELNFGDVTLNLTEILTRISVRKLLQECRGNASIVSMLIDILSVEAITDIAVGFFNSNLDSIFRSLRGDLVNRLSDIVFIGEDVKKELYDFVAEIPRNFSHLRNQLLQFSTLNNSLLAIADEADMVADHVSSLPDANKSMLHEQARYLRIESSTTVTSIDEQKNKLEDEVNHLANVSLAEMLNATFERVSEAENYLHDNGSSIADKILSRIKALIINAVPKLIEILLSSLETLLGCFPLYNILDMAFHLICDPFQPVNGLWFSLGWCLFFLTPSLIFGLWLGGLNARELPQTSSTDIKGQKPEGDNVTPDEKAESPDVFGPGTGNSNPYYFDRRFGPPPPPGYPGPTFGYPSPFRGRPMTLPSYYPVSPYDRDGKGWPLRYPGDPYAVGRQSLAPPPASLNPYSRTMPSQGYPSPYGNISNLPPPWNGYPNRAAALQPPPPPLRPMAPAPSNSRNFPPYVRYDPNRPSPSHIFPYRSFSVYARPPPNYIFPGRSPPSFYSWS